MKYRILSFIVVALLLVGGAFLIYDEVKYNEEEIEHLVDNPIPLQSYYFTAEEYPYGNQGIAIYDNELRIKVDKDLNDLTIARCAGTGSMFPTIPKNAILIMVPINESELIIGDIVSIHQEDYNIIHRIINITDDFYITKGDNNEIRDPENWTINDLDKRLVGILW